MLTLPQRLDVCGNVLQEKKTRNIRNRIRPKVNLKQLLLRVNLYACVNVATRKNQKTIACLD
jgi:hypothetical protein